MTGTQQILSLFLIVATLSSCVSNRKYLEETNARKTAQEEAAKEAQARIDAEKQLKDTQDKLTKLEAEYKEMKSDLDLLQERYNQQQRLNKDLQESYDKLLALNEKLKEDATSRKRELDDELATRTRELERREKSMRELEETLRREREAIERLKNDMAGKDANITDLQKLRAELEKELAGREKRIKDLEAAIKERDAQTEALRKKLLDALKGFADAGDLGVEVRNGKVYVSLSQKLLFSSGSSRIDKRGLDALKSLGDVLNKSNDLSILVEGHTDSDGDEKMNWELSTSRAMSVTQELIKNGVDPARLTAAGRGEHAPKAPNDTEKGKGTNRRTEIILEPKLDEILGILNK